MTLLASGGMATVYVARAQGVAGFERLVAIKVLHPHLAHDEDFISMFLDEARLAARIRHPNVVATLDISDTQGDGYFLVMEYVEGDHFGALLRAAGKGGEKLPTNVVSRIAIDALAGLNAAHRLTDSTGQPLDLVHRDVSPHNILIGGDGVGRITDFGVAKAQVRLSSTRDGQFKGKLSYMAPEQAASGNADQRSDLFSLGIVLWEALTGRRLFRGENNADVLNKILNPEAPAPSTYDDALEPFDSVMAQALAKEPEDRFQTADDFIDAIEEAATEIGTGVAGPRAVGREVKKWLGDKIERERLTIHDAIEAMGRSELTPGVLPRPIEGGSQPSHPDAASLVRQRATDLTLGAKPSTVESIPVPKTEPGGIHRGLIIALVALVIVSLIAAVAGTALFMSPGDSEVDAPPPPGAVAEPTEPVAAPDPPANDVEPAPDTTTDPAPDTTPDTTMGQAAVGNETEPASEEPVVEERAAPVTSRRRRRRRRGTRGTAPTQSPGGSAAGSDEEDDLMLNPYRR